jgi:ArsR family transcriptional regulator
MNVSAHNGFANCSAEQLSREFSALGHPVRLQILTYLTRVEGCCCKDVVCQFDLAQSTVSQHLKILLEAGLLEMQTRGQRSRYTPNKAALEVLAAAVNQLAAGLVAGSQQEEKNTNAPL